MADPWSPEIVVDADLARALVASQFPDLAGAPVERLGAGWDNTAYLVGRAAGASRNRPVDDSARGEWVFRFPRRKVALPLNEREIQILPSIAPRLPLAVSVPERIGHADERFPWPFAGHRLIRGRTACAANPDEATRIASAAPLARFLAALHAISVDEAASLGARPDEIGKLDVPHRASRMIEALPGLCDAGLLDAGVARGLERTIGETPATSPRAHVFLHGDLYARHIVVDDAGLPRGVIDWGDCCLGDPAIDLSLAHHFLPPSAHAAFRDAYGTVDDVTWRRARFRAIVHATACNWFSHSVDDADLLREASQTLRWAAVA